MTSSSGKLGNIQNDAYMAIRRGLVPGAESGFMYGYGTGIINNEQGCSQGLSPSEELEYPTSSISMSIASSDIGDFQTIEITYYADSSAETPSTQIVILNGNNEILIPIDMFRIVCLKNQSATNPVGTIWVGDTSDVFVVGKPSAALRAVMVGEAGVSHMGQIYCPPNKEILFTSYTFQSDLNTVGDTILVKFKRWNNAQPSNIGVEYYPQTQGSVMLQNVFYLKMQALDTIQLTCERTTGAGAHNMVTALSYIMYQL
jgi:hypothetical protein